MRNYWITNDLTLISETEIIDPSIIQVQGEEGLISEKYLYVENDILKRVVGAWQEPDWNFRAFITIEQLITIADLFPQMLVKLNEEPINPKYKYPTGSMVYFDTFGIEEQQLFAFLGITKQDKP